MYLKFILNKITKIYNSASFDVFEVYFKQNNKNIIVNAQSREFKKNSNWNMLKIPGKMHMYDMVKIDTIIFEIVRGGGIVSRIG